MPSIFTPEEVKAQYSLADPVQVQKGQIRGPRAQWTLNGTVTCGKYSSLNGALNARGRVRIGHYCAFGSGISLLSGNHRTDMPNQQVWLNTRFGFAPPIETKGPVEIGHNVWIGDKVNVLSGVQVGHGAVIAAGSTVTKSVPPFCIVGGSPSREIRLRFSPGVIAQMLDLCWWDWDDDRIGRNRAFFELSLAPDHEVDLSTVVVD